MIIEPLSSEEDIRREAAENTPVRPAQTVQPPTTTASVMPVGVAPQQTATGIPPVQQPPIISVETKRPENGTSPARKSVWGGIVTAFSVIIILYSAYVLLRSGGALLSLLHQPGFFPSMGVILNTVVNIIVLLLGVGMYRRSNGARVGLIAIEVISIVLLAATDFYAAAVSGFPQVAIMWVLMPSTYIAAAVIIFLVLPGVKSQFVADKR